MEIWETPPAILIMSIILTWGIGLSVPVLIRYVFLRRPINKNPAIVIVVILYFIQLFMWIGLGSTNKSHFVLVLIAYVSYEILRKHNKGEYEVIKDRDDVEFLVKSNIATEEVFEHESKTKKDSDYDEAYKKALYFIDKEGYDKALPYLELAVKTDVLSLKENVYVNIGFCYLGTHVKAIEACKQAIRIDPDFANAHLNLGFSCLQIGDKSSALNEYKILKNLDIDKANKLFDLIYK